MKITRKTKKTMPVPPDGPDISKAVIWFDSERIVNFALSNVKPSEVILFGQILVEAGMKMHGPPVKIIEDTPKDSLPLNKQIVVYNPSQSKVGDMVVPSPKPAFKVGDMVVLSPKGKAEKIGGLTPGRFKHWPAKVLRISPHDGDELYLKNFGAAHYILDNDGPPAGGVHEAFLELAPQKSPGQWHAGCLEKDVKKKRGRPKGCKDKKKRRKKRKTEMKCLRKGCSGKFIVDRGVGRCSVCGEVVITTPTGLIPKKYWDKKSRKWRSGLSGEIIQ